MFRSALKNITSKRLQSTLHLEKELYEINKAKYLQETGAKRIFPPSQKPSASIFPKLENIDPKNDLQSRDFHSAKLGIYSVSKTTTGRLPVYSEIRKNQIRETIVRRVEGDVLQLKKDLQEALPFIDPAKFKVMQESKKVVIKGDYVNEVRNVLKEVL
ncbi:mitochondrial 54S ribosomal protein [Saccharomycopsis crataegensis]|uniref:Large ribosomal subunit protein mL49 n=1 Tax=Saccharomycopsis crataegensis TaxID=43959 RepID=A0AAV5QLJ7_9ASCO|nr:mitochondrial 54S ribosomal protein [Saccharomycopsis crataegensis]